MNRVLNSFFGGCFRTLGKFFALCLIGGIIALICLKFDFKLPSFFNFLIVKADTIPVSAAQFNVYVDSNVANGCTSGEGQGYKNLDTSVNLSSYNSGVSTIAAISRIDYTATTSSTFNAGVTYTLEIIESFNPKDFDNYHTNNWSYSFEGSTSTSTSGLNAANINSYTCYIENISNNNYQVKLHCNFEPKVNLKMIYWRVNTLCDTSSVYYFNTYTLKIDSVTGSEAAINNQTTIIQNNFNETNNKIDNINDTLTDDDVDGATDEASDFFSDFTTNTHGLTGIITAPLNAIESLTSKTCTPLVLPLPYMNNKNLTLPCMRQIYLQNFGGFMTIYDVVTLGIVAYWVIVRIFALVKDFKNPEHDEIEVVDL